MRKRQKSVWVLAGSLLLLLLVGCTSGATDDVDVQALQSLLKGVKNSAALGWKSGTDPCTDNWRFIKCQGTSVTGLLFDSLGLGGTVTEDINKMKNLQTIQFQKNGFTGPLPSLSGLSALQTAYFTGNSFDTVPADFFVGLGSLTEIYLDENPLNRSTGWSLPADISQSALLTTLSLSNTSLTGFIPDFLGKMSSLKTLNLAYNRLGGGIPSSFASSNIAELRLNNQQKAPVLSGPIDVVGSMESLTILWLHVNDFTGPIPSGLANALSLKELKLNDNQLVGTIPPALTSLSTLQNFTVRNNQLVGAIPEFRSDVGFEFSGNNFCVPTPGQACSPEVTGLLDFMEGVQFPSLLTDSWKGNDACGAGTAWLGIGCGTGANNVSVLSLANSQLNGTISPSLGNLTTLTQIKLNNNRLKGVIPDSLTKLPVLESLDVSNNLLSAPVPVFPARVRLIVTGNPLTPAAPSTPKAPGTAPAPGNSSSASPDVSSTNKTKSATGAIAGAVVGIIGALLLALGACLLLYKKKGKRFMHLQGTNTVVIHPRGGDSNSDPETVKIVVANSGSGTNSQLNSRTNSGPSEVHVVETGNLVISIHVLREATKNFSESSILGRGGFGVVYKGVLDDGTAIAVKRMEAGSVVSNKGLSEFQAEIAVLTKVRHRHLVALLGYCIEGNEKLLVYEYMPQGTLSQHLFEYDKLGYKPLDWKQRLSIALDVGRGMEYLHGLAHKSFIHRDLKPSNILLGDDLRAKVSDFGLVKLAPEGKYSVETRLAGTFGYLAPEYAVTGRVTTKADVFSFGVVLMELITGRRALDETQAEENMHLVTWFRRMSIAASKDNKKVLVEAIDKALLDSTNIQDETFLSSVSIVAELAGHCTAREPYQRPDMGHVVNVLSPLVEHWKPSDDEDENGGIDLDMPLPQAVKKWQELDSSYMNSNVNRSDTQTSLPPRPSGFADSFTSDDAR